MKHKGFTLVELMVVIVIMGILAAMGTIQFAGVVGRGRIKGAAEKISREILGARERALSQGQAIDVVFSASPNNNLVITINRLTNPVVTTVLPTFTDCRVGVIASVNRRLPETGVIVAVPPAIDFPANTCRFMPQGASTVGGIYITSNNGRYQFGIGVNANGRVRKSEWGGTAWN